MTRRELIWIMAAVTAAVLVMLSWIGGPAPDTKPSRLPDPVRRFERPAPDPMAKRILPWQPATEPARRHAAPRVVNEPVAERDAIENEFVLAFFNAYDRRAFMARAESAGVTVLDTVPWAHAVRVRITDRDAYERLLRDGPSPVEAEPNYSVRLPRSLVGKTPVPAGSGYVGFGASAASWLGVPKGNRAWGEGVTVAVLDTGVMAHPALEHVTVRTVHVEGAPNGTGTAHGTAVASLIAGRSEQLQGVAPSVTILNMPVMSGSGDTFTLAKAIVTAVDEGAQIINLCLGSYGDAFILRQAVAYAREKGVAMVASTGNDAVEGVVYPARYEGVVAVSAVDAAGRHLFFANRGPEVDVAAPGLGVTAAWQDNEVVSFSGTSAATPFVSGVLAALVAQFPDVSPAELARRVVAAANDGGAPGADDEFGQGIPSIRRVQEWGVAGIHDMAAADVSLGPPGQDGALSVTVSAQNRGTERLAVVDVNVMVDGRPTALRYYDVGVGQTVSQAFSIQPVQMIDGKPVTVEWSVSIPGVDDAYPGNNRRHGTVIVANQVPTQ